MTTLLGDKLERDGYGKIIIPDIIKDLKLPESLKEDIVNSRVRAWILDGKLLLSSTFGDNPENKKIILENLLSALNVAKQYGLDEVGFDGSPQDLHNLRQIGLFDRAPRFYTGSGEKTLSQMRKSVKKDYMHTDAGNLVFYVPASHERLVTVSTIEALGKIVNNRNLFLARLSELVEGRKQNSLGTSNFEFLTVGEKRLNETVSYYRKKKSSELSAIHEELSKFNKFCQGIQSENWHSFLKQIRKHLNNFLKYYKDRTASIFHKDELFNPQWLRVQYGINRGIDEETSLENLPDEFSGMYRIEKCGYIGWYDNDNRVHLGLKPLSECPKDIDKAETIHYKDQEYFIVRSDIADVATKIYFKDQNGSWFERTFIFQENMSQTVKELQNWTLEYKPDLKWSCIASIPEVVSLWDIDPEMIRNLWYPTRSVFFVQLETESGEKEQFWIREYPWSKNLFEYKKKLPSLTARVQESVMKRFIKMQFLMMNELGANCPEFIHATFPLSLHGYRDNVADNNSRLIQTPFIIRKYLPGMAMGHITILGNDKINPEWCTAYAGVLGKLASINWASRKKIFESIDEVIDQFDINGNPVGASYVSTLTTFRYERVTKPLLADAPLYGFHLAALKEKVKLAYGDTFSENVERIFLSNFEIGWRGIQNKMFQQDLTYMKHIESYYSLSMPVDERWDFRKTFKMADDAIKGSNVDELKNSIILESEKAQKFFENIIANVNDSNSINEIFQEATYLLNSVWLSHQGLDSVYKIINSDKEFQNLKVKERIHRLNALHTSITCKMLGVPLHDVVDLVSKFSSKGKSYLSMRNNFISNFNSIFQKQYQTTVGLNLGLAQRFFDALQQGDGLKERIQQLVQLGYLDQY